MNEIELKAGLAKTPGYRYASLSGDQIHVAGQVPQDSSGQIRDINDPYGQATRCLRNLEILLACYDFAMNDIRHLTVYVVGARENLTTAWKGVLSYFLDDVPPATLIGVSLLGYENQLVEIDATIVRKPGDSYQ